MTPKGVNDWWKQLSSEEQAEYLALHPDVIGNLDGIPATTRDEANRVNIANLIGKYEAKGNISESDQEKLDGFISIQNRLDSNADKAPSAFLLGVSDESQGRAILSYGNPDTAENVAAYVPGLNTGLSNVGGGDGQRAWNIWNSANNADPTQSTASMVWLGYDAPQSELSADSDNLDVMSEGRGVRGGASFDHFLDGVKTTHTGDDPHVTAIGHSYGSFTVGQAAQNGNIAADDIVLVGSPGTGAQKADQLGVGSDHVWVGSAESDPVTHLPSKNEVAGTLGGATAGGLPGAVIGGAIGHVVGDDHELWFGQDPASQGFGGNRFDVADGEATNSHSNYFDPTKGGDSLKNIGNIVTGNYGSVTEEGKR
jgi:hypothetical protein